MSRCRRSGFSDNPFKTEAGKQLIQVAAERGAVEHVLSDAEEHAGMEMQELQKVLGHTDISMTNRYYHLTKKVNDKMRDILNKRAAM
ncbi:MAG TPA: tyrosine-type recombinase/integrase [Pyrinomonadaceae bacterium]|nr:tyrosine-type recombinase/integrase [Pyrinomonadaceae bacterium]